MKHGLNTDKYPCLICVQSVAKYLLVKYVIKLLLRIATIAVAVVFLQVTG